jgi:hypothetical protein
MKLFGWRYILAYLNKGSEQMLSKNSCTECNYGDESYEYNLSISQHEDADGIYYRYACPVCGYMWDEDA